MPKQYQLILNCLILAIKHLEDRSKITLMLGSKELLLTDINSLQHEKLVTLTTQQPEHIQQLQRYHSGDNIILEVIVDAATEEESTPWHISRIISNITNEAHVA